jgi:hypothetical protein
MFFQHAVEISINAPYALSTRDNELCAVIRA